MSRFARRIDANQTEIVTALRCAGAWVYSTAALGGGFPDLLCYARGMFFLLEVKDGNKPPSARKLTEAEAAFVSSCPGPVHVVCSVSQALIAIGLTGPEFKPIREDAL
jgi:hypothetical protein